MKQNAQDWPGQFKFIQCNIQGDGTFPNMNVQPCIITRAILPLEEPPQHELKHGTAQSSEDSHNYTTVHCKVFTVQLSAEYRCMRIALK